MSDVLLKEYLALLGKQGVTVAAAPTKITDKDVLLVIDMQNDFLPGGSFGVAEGDACVPGIAALMEQFSHAGAKIFCSRDYHPIIHCSFSSHGGPFPPHCVQGTAGAEFCTGIAAALQPLTDAGKAQIVFKGFCKEIDSFGAFPYSQGEVTGGSRLSKTAGADRCAPCWTGSFVLFSSNLGSSVNAPPDVMSVLDKVSLTDAIGMPMDGRRIFVCGLALDFCVLDTALNATLAGFKETSIFVDCTRAAHIPGVGKHGSGFLTDPASFAEQLKNNSITLVASKQ